MENLKQTLPPGLADAAANIPGVGAVIQLFIGKFGLDVGNMMSFYLLLFGIYQGAVFLYGRGKDYLMTHGTSAVRIDDDDDLYPLLISWISAQRMTLLSRDLKASSRKPRARYADTDDEDSDPDDNDVLDESGIFKYDKWSGASPVFYEPNIGDDSFTHNGRHFQFRKDCQENKYAERIEYFLIIRCMGRSTQPVKNLIDHVKEWSNTKPNSMTSIYRAEPKRGTYWSVQSRRPSRPISTVTLDQEQKDQIVADINDYLQPATARWYAARGIPHRRGYLFHGPPGTGKTSLSFAAAGIFGLSIYCASLSEPDLGESELASLFSQLPDRCIVLLEDIDSAGIRREGSSSIAVSDADSDADDEAEKIPEKKVEHKKIDERNGEMINLEKKKTSLRRRLTRHLQSNKSPAKPDSETTTLVSKDDAASATSTSERPATPKPKSKPTLPDQESASKSKISLAGLLNIIDGAASSEGRVLIMTTNCPEKLDSALIRPGRVDLQIKFTLATNAQIQEIFRRMYSDETATVTAAAAVAKSNKDEATKKKDTTTAKTTPRYNFATLPADQLTRMAKTFADTLPELVFSPAEIQGYLLMRKMDPMGAVEGVAEWRDGVLEARRKGKKVVEVR
ncbi:mitochondrial chaperone bcs1 [Stemphylium lycopersici]|nr:mitochondrial chaperone bcs1 [Stemphylium lycopersici]